MALTPVSSVTAGLLCAAALVLSSCGSGGGIGPLLKGALGGNAANAPRDAATIPRAEIEQAGVPILRVKVPSRGLDMLLAERDRRGDLVTWAAGDGSTFTFRKGVLIETRGLGADLMSSAAPTADRIAAGGSYQRSYFYIGPDETMQRRDYTCTAEVVGNESVAIYGLAYPTRHIVERCERPEGFITNDFWLHGANPRKSEQWVSEAIGSIQVEQVTD